MGKEIRRLPPLKSTEAFEAVLDLLVEMTLTGGRIRVMGIEACLGLKSRRLEAYVRRLGRAGLLCGKRGRGGGTTLAKAAADIYLGDVWRAVRSVDAEHLMLYGRKKNRPEPSRTEMRVAIQDKLALIEARMMAELDAVTLEEFVETVHQQFSRVQSTPCQTMIAAR